MLNMQDFFTTISHAASKVLTDFLGLQTSSMAAAEKNKSIDSDQISIIIQIIGDVEGQVISSLDVSTAKHLIGRMFGGMTIEHIDEMGWSALQEFANWLVSGIATSLSERGVNCNITHPVINEGKSVIRNQQPFTLVPIQSEAGRINIYSSVQFA